MTRDSWREIEKRVDDLAPDPPAEDPPDHLVTYGKSAGWSDGEIARVWAEAVAEAERSRSADAEHIACSRAYIASLEKGMRLAERGDGPDDHADGGQGGEPA